MIQVLEQLSGEVGIRGALLVARDGIPIASSAIRGVDQDTVCAITSALLLTLKSSLSRLCPSGDFSKFVLTTAHGRLVFVDAECDAFLVVLTDKNINLDVTELALSAAAHRIRKLTELTDVSGDSAERE